MAGTPFPTLGEKPAASPPRLSRMRAENVIFFSGETQALSRVSLEIPDRHVLALVGPSCCGKSTFLRTLNRMNDLVPGARLEGQVLLDDKDIYERSIDFVDLCRRVGMVFQRSNPFRKSIYENVAYGPRIHGSSNRPELDGSVEDTLRRLGRKSSQDSTSRRYRSPVESNNVFVWRVLSRSNQMYF